MTVELKAGTAQDLVLSMFTSDDPAVGDGEEPTWIVERTVAQLRFLHDSLRRDLTPVAGQASAQLPLPPASASADDGTRSDLRAVERYVISLLELDCQWAALGQRSTLQGLHDLIGQSRAAASEMSTSAYFNAHTRLMRFLDSRSEFEP